MLDEAREILGVPKTTKDQRQLLSKMNELLDAQAQGNQAPQPQPQPAAPIAVKPEFMPTIIKHLTSSLRPLWEHQVQDLRRYYFPSHSSPSQPPKQWNPRLYMLLELDFQVEVAWRGNKLKDDDREQAAT